jgi:hypothetical protein
VDRQSRFTIQGKTLGGARSTVAIHLGPLLSRLAF